MRFVLDTNILIRANPRPRGPARELLQELLHSDHVLITSPFLLQELARVLAYPRIEARWKLTPGEVEEYLQLLAGISEIVAPLPGSPVVLSDVDDDPVIYTAVAAKADVLCTLDAHFYEQSVKGFCAKHNIKIMDDVGLLRAIRRK